MGSLTRWWWFFPVLGALICGGIMALLVSGNVADEARDGALVALDGVGLGDDVAYAGIEGFDGMGGDGLNVILEGPRSAETEAVTAVEARSEVDRVIYRPTDESDDLAIEPEPEPADEPQPTVAPGLDPASVSATPSGDEILLVGTLPDEGMRQDLITAAVNEYGAANVTHDLAVDPENVMAVDGVMIVSGQALSEDEKSEWLVRAAPLAAAADLSLVDEVVVQSVEESLNSLFALEPIEFDVNQATIRSRSIQTLDAAAEMIKSDSTVGRLRVVGHTDSDGSSRRNQQLSEARAQAVVAYLVDTGGVESGRLEAEGRGEAQLLVEPEVTPEDKQRNRRIEWELIS